MTWQSSKLRGILTLKTSGSSLCTRMMSQSSTLKWIRPWTKHLLSLWALLLETQIPTLTQFTSHRITTKEARTNLPQISVKEPKTGLAWELYSPWIPLRLHMVATVSMAKTIRRCPDWKSCNRVPKLRARITSKIKHTPGEWVPWRTPLTQIISYQAPICRKKSTMVCPIWESLSAKTGLVSVSKSLQTFGNTRWMTIESRLTRCARPTLGPPCMIDTDQSIKKILWQRKQSTDRAEKLLLLKQEKSLISK